MLVLTRKKRQTVVIGDPGGGEALLLITVLEIARGRVQIGFVTTAVNNTAIPIHRGEIWTGGEKQPVGIDPANLNGSAGRNVIEAIRSRLDGPADPPVDSNRPAGLPSRSMREIVATARSRQRLANPVTIEPEWIEGGAPR